MNNKFNKQNKINYNTYEFYQRLKTHADCGEGVVSPTQQHLKKGNVKTGETTVTAKVSIGQIENGGFGLAAELAINIPGVGAEQAQELAEQAHQVCPYSNATRGNVEVKLSVTTT